MGLVQGAANESKEVLALKTLNKRERLIFTMLGDMRTNKEMAEELGVSLKTIKWHVSNIYRKLSIDPENINMASKRVILTRDYMDCKFKEWVKI